MLYIKWISFHPDRMDKQLDSHVDSNQKIINKQAAAASILLSFSVHRYLILLELYTLLSLQILIASFNRTKSVEQLNVWSYFSLSSVKDNEWRVIMFVHDVIVFARVHRHSQNYSLVLRKFYALAKYVFVYLYVCL